MVARRNPGLPGWCETPVADRQAEEGCYTTAIVDLGVPARGPLFWYLDTFPTRAAAEAQRGPRSTSSAATSATGCSRSLNRGGSPPVVNVSRPSVRW